MYIPNDKFARRAKKEGYRARSAYKLLDIQRKFRIMKSGDFVLDLGAAPGSWMQVVSNIIGKEGKVLGVDKESVASLVGANTKVLAKDVFDADLAGCVLKHFGGKVDIVISDMAPSTTGMRGRDEALSYELAGRALEIVLAILKERGNAVIKIFEGEETRDLLSRVKKTFASIKIVKPAGSQKGSREMYIVARTKQKGVPPSPFGRGEARPEALRGG